LPRKQFRRHRQAGFGWTAFDEISEKSERLLDPAILSNGLIEEKSVVVAR
jgi:hypothetical protein